MTIFSQVFSKIVLFSLCALFLSTPALSQPGFMMQQDMDEDYTSHNMGRWGHMYGPRGGMHRGEPGMPIMNNMMGMFMGSMADLELTKAQRSKIRELHRAMRKQHLKLMEQMMDAVDKLTEVYENDIANIEKIGSAYDDVYKIKRNMILQHVETRNKVIALLDDKQKEKFKSSRPFPGRQMMMY